MDWSAFFSFVMGRFSSWQCPLFLRVIASSALADNMTATFKFVKKNYVEEAFHPNHIREGQVVMVKDDA
ncbi:hypothetical protein ACO1KN_13790, partial [Staphylococcus aureus]